MASQYTFNRATGKFEQRRGGRRGKRFYQLASNESFVGWETHDVSADASMHGQLVSMVARARDLERNNDYVIRHLALQKANVIGPRGFKFTSCRKARNGRVDRTFNRALEAAWKAAGKLKHSPTTCGKMTRKDLLDLVLDRWMVDGECLVIHHPGFAENKWRYAVQVVDSMRLDWTLNGRLPNGNAVKMGVEVDEYDRPVAYHILDQHPSEGIFGWNATNRPRQRIEAEHVTHVYSIERPGQSRGVTHLAAPGLRARMLDKFEEAVVLGARIAASKMGFYKPNDEYDGEAPGEDENGTADLRQEVEPGLFELLPRGLDVDTFDPNYPPANLEEFHKTIARGIASGLGGNYNHIFNNYEGVNYSSLREAKLTDRDAWRTLQGFIVDHFEEPNFLRWAMVQQINKVAGLDSAKLAASMADDCYRFSGRGWQWVDPLKEVQAANLAIAGGHTSPQRIIEDTSGADPEELLEETAEFMKMAEAQGVPLSWAQPELPLNDQPGNDNAGGD
jgi:lambda family phage portal protein